MISFSSSIIEYVIQNNSTLKHDSFNENITNMKIQIQELIDHFKPTILLIFSCMPNKNKRK